ncbi:MULTISPECIES: nuclear transport factor 2 family protein [unclassified Nocardioides]|uniref:nuclear transport factor 2 family protein n=1 Tax=unclassified Nocardioides TaxID=2615069 RepID=UPI00360F9E06
MTDTAALARAFVQTLDARDWDAWTALLDPEVVYLLPQTRERISGRAAYLEFNQTYPGDWSLRPKVVIADAERAVVWFEWSVGAERSEAQVFLEFGGDGLVTRVTDFWPESYDPPERMVDTVERY